LLVAATARRLLAVLAGAAGPGIRARIGHWLVCRSCLTTVTATLPKADLAAFPAVCGATFVAPAKRLAGLAATPSPGRAAVLAIGAATVGATRRRRSGSRPVARWTRRVLDC